MLIEGLPEPDLSSQDSELGLLSEDTASMLDDLYADATDDDVSDLFSDDSFASVEGQESSKQHQRRHEQPGLLSLS